MPNFSVFSESVASESSPVPLSPIVAPLFRASVVTVRLPVRKPCCVGVKSIPRVHVSSGGDTDPLGPSVVPLQVSSTVLKSPDGVTLVTVNGTMLRFVSVAVLPVLVLPTTVLANALAGERPRSPALPLPVRFTTCGLSEAFEGIVIVPVYAPTADAEALKLTLTAHVVATVWLEHVSSPGTIWKFREGVTLTGPLGVPVVVV